MPNKSVNLAADEPLDDYDRVLTFWDSGNARCSECIHYTAWTEPHGERMSACSVIDSIPEQVPNSCLCLDPDLNGSGQC